MIYFEDCRLISNIFSDSVSAWIDVANNCKRFVANQAGTDALDSWISSLKSLNAAMAEIDFGTAMLMLVQMNESFANVTPHLKSPELSKYFKKANVEFGKLIESIDLPGINAYLKKSYPLIKKILKC